MASSQKREVNTPAQLPWIPPGKKTSFNAYINKKNSKQELPEFGKSNAKEIFGGAEGRKNMAESRKSEEARRDMEERMRTVREEDEDELEEEENRRSNSADGQSDWTFSTTVPDSVSIFVGTWNMMERQPPTADLVDFILPEGIGSRPADLVVVGTQESHGRTREWDVSLQAILGDTHGLVHSMSEGALHQVVFLRKDLVEHLSEPQAGFKVNSNVSTKTKGAVYVAFVLLGTSFLFVNCHLAANTENIVRRKRYVRDIINSLDRRMEDQFPRDFPLRDGGKNLFKKFDCTFWYGDLNFRREPEETPEEAKKEVIRLERDGNFKRLLGDDQLKKEMEAENIFVNFEEAEVNFPPSYKYNPATNDYSKARVPSYTDRILFRSQVEIFSLHYYSAQSVKTSDHKPVWGVWKVEAVDPEADQLRRMAKMDKEVLRKGMRLRSAEGLGIEKLFQHLMQKGPSPPGTLEMELKPIFSERSHHRIINSGYTDRLNDRSNSSRRAPTLGNSTMTTLAGVIRNMVRNAVASKGGVAGEEGRSRSGTPSRKRLLTESERLEEEERKKGLRRKAVAAMGVTIIVGLLILLIVFLVAYEAPPVHNSSEGSISTQTNSNLGSGDPCTQYKVLRESWRNIPASRVVPAGTPTFCDIGGFQEGWHRFEPPAGTHLPTSAPGAGNNQVCGTNVVAWLNGAHPKVHEGTLNVEICFEWVDSPCQYKMDSQARTCQANDGSTFYVYYLKYPGFGCNYAYCAL